MSVFPRITISIVFHLFLAVALIGVSTPEALARGGSHGGSGHSGGYSGGHSRGGHSSSRSYNSGGHSSRSHSSNYSGRSSTHSHLGVSRHSSISRIHNSSGTYKTGYAKVERSETAKRQFLRQHGLTRIPQGMHIDHIRPLSQGGSDTPGNMQLLSIEAHHHKTAAERRHY